MIIDVSKETLHNHRKARSKEYRSWRSITARGLKGYYCGISNVFLGKNGFKNFMLEMGYAPGEKYTVDRIDNSKGYEPGNLRWATRLEQANNTTRNIYITLWGEKYTVADALRIFNIPRYMFNYYALGSQCKRVKGPLSYEDAFATILVRRLGAKEEAI